MSKERKVPSLLKWLFCAFMAFYIPVYLTGYGPQNFLWLSSVILILTFLATVFESRFLASMATVGGLVFESLWTLDFLFTVIALMSGSSVTGFTGYTINPNLSILVRIAALFHLALPPLLIFLILRLGYNAWAWMVQIVLCWVLVLASWFFTNPSLNINLVYSYLKFEPLNIGAIPLLSILFATAVVVCSGTHFFLQAFQKRYSR